LAENQPIVDFSLFDLNHPIADKSVVEKNIPQRFEMAQLDGILYEDRETLRAVGFKHLSRQEFWVRGHMPDFALMPGVMMCEAAAQVIAYMAARFDFSDEGIMVFGGLDGVRFRGMVLPGDTLITMVGARRLRRNTLVICDFQGYVGTRLVVDGEIMGAVLRPNAVTG
jgi:3-hydroxyacyl-[acyl-carrier-protein] dehydratase